MTAILFSTSSFDLDNVPDRRELERSGVRLLLNPFGRKLTEDEIATLLREEGVVGLVAGLEPLTSRVLEGAPTLRAIARVGIGLDTVDLRAAAARDITVFHTPEPPAIAVAELTLAHILGALRHVTAADRAIRADSWKGRMGVLLHGKTVGIVGFGRIGRRLARLLEPFEVRVIATDTDRHSSSVEYVTLDELLASSDVVSLHVPYSPDTHHLIGTRELAIMRPSAILVNVARGGLIDEDALKDALLGGTIAGAALDCFESEPYDGPLRELDTVQMTAHMGTYAAETRGEMEREAATLIVDHLRASGLI
jgi:D-3-phosphoglycerate dehydrogenase